VVRVVVLVLINKLLLLGDVTAVLVVDAVVRVDWCVGWLRAFSHLN
jgi:hypothetical protein